MLDHEVLDLVHKRYEAFHRIFFEPVTDAHMETFRLTVGLNINEEIYKKRYENDPERFKRYIIFARWYVFFFYAGFYDERYPENVMATEIDYDGFMAKMCQKLEFRDVHYSWRLWYPAFRERIDRLIHDAGFDPTAPPVE